MANNLKQAHWKGRLEDLLRRFPEFREPHERGHEEDAVEGDESELDECEGYGVSKLIEESFAGVGGER